MTDYDIWLVYFGVTEAYDWARCTGLDPIRRRPGFPATPEERHDSTRHAHQAMERLKHRWGDAWTYNLKAKQRALRDAERDYQSR